MHDYGVSKEAGQKIDEDMDHLKEGWARLCEELESARPSRSSKWSSGGSSITR